MADTTERKRATLRLNYTNPTRTGIPELSLCVVGDDGKEYRLPAGSIRVYRNEQNVEVFEFTVAVVEEHPLWRIEMTEASR